MSQLSNKINNIPDIGYIPTGLIVGFLFCLSCFLVGLCLHYLLGVSIVGPIDRLGHSNPIIRGIGIAIGLIVLFWVMVGKVWYDTKDFKNIQENV